MTSSGQRNHKLAAAFLLAACVLASPAFADSPEYLHPSSSSAAFILSTSTPRQDTDADGMPDDWEIAHGLNPLLDDRWLDPDQDGAPNIVEYNRGTDPRQSDSGVSAATSQAFTLSLVQRPTDTDGDGMPDSWELAHRLNPNLNDAQADSDGDGLLNLAEYNAGTDPQVSEPQHMASALSLPFICDSGGFPLGYLADSDGDGMPDWWEIRYGLNPYLADSSGDMDGDGASNLLEFLTGRLPNFDETSGGVWALSQFFRLDTAGRPVDTDGDGMPDWWEIAHGLNPNLPDATADNDNDGRNNLAEYNSGTDPQVDDWRGPTRALSAFFVLDTGGFWGGYLLDSDHDGMPDWWEVAHNLNPMADDSLADPDGDGIPNLLEFQLGLDPFRSGSDGFGIAFSPRFPLRTIRDDDHDGMDDDWELRLFGIAHVPPDADADGDGLTNLQEFKAGTNPKDAGSKLVLSLVPDIVNGGRLLRWTSSAYRLYAIDRATNLTEGFSQIVATDIVATAPQNSFIDLTATNAAAYFYRIRVIPQQ